MAVVFDMNISGSMAASASGAQAYDAVGITVQRKAMDIQASQANQLIQSVAKSMPQPQGNIGRNIDVFA